MENGQDWKIAEKFSGLTFSAAADHDPIPPSTTFAAAVANNNHHQDSSLMQVMKAMEAAEATIKQQVEENIRLRTQLEHKMLELHRYKLNESPQIDGRPETQLGGGAAASTPTSFSPERSSGEFSANGGGFMMPVAVSESNKKDLIVKVNEHEHEIMQLRKHLADYSVKEAQIRNEKYALEKRIAYMRLAFDQQQQDLADAASKALSYRQDIIEENIRLAYAVQDAQQERTTFVSSLLPILAEYSLEPPVPDAQSIVGNVKVLFRHLQEKLLLTEGKLKELQYQLTPWRSDTNQQQQSSNISISAPQSPLPDSAGGAALLNVSRNGLEMVAQNQGMYASQAPVSTSDALTTMDWGPSGFGGGGVTNNVDQHNDMMGRYSPVPRSTSGLAQDVPVNHGVAQGDTRGNHNSEGTSNRQVKFRDPVRHMHRDIDDQDADGNHNERDSSNWSAGTSPFASPLNAHYLAPVLEEGSSSYSEAADDDPLPAIENLQISGEAFPGHELQASGYSINGTTSCNFEWVRHLQDGSVNYIDGAKQPTYLVTADDVDTYLAIEVQPLDNRKRKGELVKVFANEHNKITCDPEMQGQIEKTLYKGQASFKVLQYTGYLDIWEPATLAIKRGAYSIKCSGGGPSGSSVVVAEKFLPNTMVTIPYGSPTEFIILSGSDSGREYLMRADNESCSRDTVVLLLRFFIHKADERKNTRKAKIGSYFFNKYL